MDNLKEELVKAEKELASLRKKINELRKQSSGEEVENFELADSEGNTVKLHDLFGDKNDLIVIHNMGKGCPYCTLWADGFNGVYQHLESRAGLALVSHDSPEEVKKFATGRGWKFRVLSNNGGQFTKSMGYENEKGGPTPVFQVSTKIKTARSNVLLIPGLVPEMISAAPGICLICLSREPMAGSRILLTTHSKQATVRYWTILVQIIDLSCCQTTTWTGIANLYNLAPTPRTFFHNTIPFLV